MYSKTEPWSYTVSCVLEVHAVAKGQGQGHSAGSRRFWRFKLLAGKSDQSAPILEFGSVSAPFWQLVHFFHTGLQRMIFAAVGGLINGL
jgi:hypothetical protein